MAFLTRISLSQKEQEFAESKHRSRSRTSGTAPRSDARKEGTVSRVKYLERMAAFFERGGFPRMAGRIFGLLLTEPDELVSTSAILKRLHASRGSVSTMTRILIEHGMIEKTARQGRREDHFRVKADALPSLFAKRLEIVQDFKAIMADAMRLTECESRNGRMVKELTEFYEWFEKRLPELEKEWELEKAKRNS
ncbi:MAG TPA: hypothetical protein DEA96_01750 [Leptospiraceae bacterium]|nr:hypothetical protein [Spirochaetaceae bacterium]HBS03658.1 hypothetical protein [Leptospiraceae bacterium]|tara:strand:- start:230283 stop:230864 length:582 start_codon:yes stop_codon:yes gene_type:complete